MTHRILLRLGHLRIRLALVLETRVPAEIRRASRLYDLALQFREHSEQQARPNRPDQPRREASEG